MVQQDVQQEHPEIYVLGVQGAGCSSLVRAVVSHPRHPATEASPEQPATEVAWHIDNKYYTVSTVIKVLRANHQHQAQVAHGTRPEAVVLVVHGCKPDSWGPVKAWAEQHDLEEAGVRLVVVTHADCLLPTQHSTAGPEEQQDGLEPVRGGWLEACRDWCAEHQYEYVEVCSTDATLDAVLRQDGDAQGIGRVVEALHAHMWPGLMRKPASKALHIRMDDAGSLPAADASCQVAEASSTASKADQSQPSNGTQAGQQQEQGHASKVQAGNQHRLGQQMDEAELDMFEELMEQMAAAKYELSGLDDATRRARAAELAMRFASLLEDDDSEGVPSDASDFS